MQWLNWHWWDSDRDLALFAFLAALAAGLAWLWTRRQLTLARRTIQLDGLARVAEMLQSEKMRGACRYLYNKPHNLDSPKYQDAAERVSHVYNTIGFLVQQRLIDKELILGNWGPSIVEMWDAALPWIHHRQMRECDRHLVSSFRWLRNQAETFTADRR